MKIIIEIPKEFEKEWNKDQFEDSLNRLSADANLLAGNYEQETAAMLIKAFKKSTAITAEAALDTSDRETAGNCGIGFDNL